MKTTHLATSTASCPGCSPRAPGVHVCSTHRPVLVPPPVQLGPADVARLGELLLGATAAANAEAPVTTLEEAAMIATGLGALGQIQSLEPTVLAALCQPGRRADPADG